MNNVIKLENVSLELKKLESQLNCLGLATSPDTNSRLSEKDIANCVDNIRQNLLSTREWLDDIVEILYNDVRNGVNNNG